MSVLFGLAFLIYKILRFQCLEKGPPVARHSINIETSKLNDVVASEYKPSKNILSLDNGVSFKIKNAWLENIWEIDCIENRSQLIKWTDYQFVVNGTLVEGSTPMHFYLGKIHLDGRMFDSLLCYRPFLNQDTFRLPLYKDSNSSFKNIDKGKTLDTITFFKVSR